MGVTLGVGPASSTASPATITHQSVGVWSRLEGTVIAIVLVALGLRNTLVSELTVGGALAIGLSPVWLVVLRQYRGARVLAGLVIAACLSGLWLALGQEARAISAASARADMLLVVTMAAGVGVVLWARTSHSTAWVGFWFGLGLLLNSVLNPGELTASNPWKFGFVVPVTVLLLSILHGRKRLVLQFAVLVLLAVFSIVHDARSISATLLLAAVLVLWQLRPRHTSRSRSWVWAAGTLAGLGYTVYELSKALLLEGYLGAEAQARSLEQVGTAGSLILGGRPEAAASWALLRDNVWGYGVGVVPTLHDINVASAGMTDALGYPPDSGYLKNYMFGDGIELHSTAADLWAHFGIVGCVLAFAILFHVVRGAAVQITRREAGGLLLFLTLWTLWNLLFSPIYSAEPTMMIAIGLTILPFAGNRPTA